MFRRCKLLMVGSSAALSAVSMSGLFLSLLLLLMQGNGGGGRADAFASLAPVPVALLTAGGTVRRPVPRPAAQPLFLAAQGGGNQQQQHDGSAAEPASSSAAAEDGEAASAAATKQQNEGGEQQQQQQEQEEEDPALVALKEEIAKLENDLKAMRRRVSAVQDSAEDFTKAGYARKVAEMENMRRARTVRSSLYFIDACVLCALHFCFCYCCSHLFLFVLLLFPSSVTFFLSRHNMCI
jgi:hypothetical protein